MSAVLISGFPGVGKSYLKNLYEELYNDIIILDSDSSNFSWSLPGVRNPDFTNNYIRHIKDNLETADVILISSHKVVREALAKENIEYTLVYPDISLKDEYINRYIQRGSPQTFIDKIIVDWETFVTECGNDEFPTKVKLNAGEYLNKVYLPESDMENVMIKYFYCAKCGKTYPAKIDNFTIHAQDSNVQYDLKFNYMCECGFNANEIDPVFINVIEKMNNTNMYIEECFCGDLKIFHRNENTIVENPFIRFSSNITMGVYTDILGKYPLPSGWDFYCEPDESNEDKNMITITHYGPYPSVLTHKRFNEIKQKYIEDIIRWIELILTDEDIMTIISK